MLLVFYRQAGAWRRTDTGRWQAAASGTDKPPGTYLGRLLDGLVVGQGYLLHIFFLLWQWHQCDLEGLAHVTLHQLGPRLGRNIAIGDLEVGLRQ